MTYTTNDKGEHYLPDHIPPPQTEQIDKAIIEFRRILTDIAHEVAMSDDMPTVELIDKYQLETMKELRKVLTASNRKARIDELELLQQELNFRTDEPLDGKIAVFDTRAEITAEQLEDRIATLKGDKS